MGRNKDATKKELLDHLISVVQELPADQIAEVSEFAEELKENSKKLGSERGSIEAIIETMNKFGPLEFEPGELENLLAEISAMRELDLGEHD